MAWEKRKYSRNTYYYRSRRLADGTVHKTYIGTGPLADLAADADQGKHDEEARLADQHSSLLADVHRVATHIEVLSNSCDLIMEAALLAADYHNHRGEWRRKRHGRHTT
jgi:hypothetical protein